MSRAEIKNKIAELQEEFEKKGLEHNNIFQSTHARLKIQPKRGHWQQDFLKKIVCNEEFDCSACTLLYNKYVLDIDDPQAQADQQDVAPPDAEVPDVEVDGLQPRKRGRPKKGSQYDEDFLKKYILQNRRGVYTETETSHSGSYDYFCVPCNRPVPMFRNALTYLKEHEKCSSHVKGLAYLKLSVDGKRDVAETVPCRGVLITELSAEDTCGQLHLITDSIRSWIAAGMPCIVSITGKSLLLEQSTWRMDGEQIILRHKDCLAIECADGCPQCKTFAQQPRLMSEIAKWSYKIDLATLAQLLAYSTSEEQKKHVGLMRTRDYRRLDLAGSDLNILLKQSNRQQILHIRKAIESVASCRRNQAFEAFVNLRLRGLAEFSVGDIQKDVFSTLISRFQSAIECGSAMEDVLW